jgi:hypothetical protein
MPVSLKAAVPVASSMTCRWEEVEGGELPRARAGSAVLGHFVFRIKFEAFEQFGLAGTF